MKTNNCKCEYCGIEFYRAPSRIKIGRGKHCSRKCYAESLKITQRGSNHPSWKGGSFERSGYRFIWKPDHPHANNIGYVREHRLVMEEKLGRILDLKEIVHHINGDKLDNRPENLSLIVSNSKHAVMHFTGRKFTEEHKKKLSESRKGKVPYIPDEEQCKARSERMIKLRAERFWSSGHEGQKHSIETRQKISLGLKESWKRRKENKD
jgi:hypothetical protein